MNPSLPNDVEMHRDRQAGIGPYTKALQGTQIIIYNQMGHFKSIVLAYFGINIQAPIGTEGGKCLLVAN